jgi:hypothetical protein
MDAMKCFEMKFVFVCVREERKRNLMGREKENVRKGNEWVGGVVKGS